ncbi:LytTR family DNA-binding domain-containing protein [Streptococcus pseudoporcinus]|uniref:LytTR family DNA-binding domain-containing protein n=1 Tax=Streptococcus pseudoporcinus TaxID=361101 RepID=UPI002FD01911
MEKTLHTISEDAFVYKTEKVHVQVPFKDILYFETSQTVHKVNLVTKNGQMEFYGKISDIGKSDTRLFQSHRSFVVNPENITKVDRKNRIIYFEKNRSCFFQC